MKTILIQPITLFSNEYIKFSAPTHLVILHTFLKQKNFESDLINLPSDGPTPPQNVTDLSRYYFDLVKFFSKFDNRTVFGISCYTSLHYTASILTAMAIKQAIPNTKIIIAGYGVMYTSTDLNNFGSLFDYVVIGEGEYELLRILHRIESDPNQVTLHPTTLLSSQLNDLNIIDPLNWKILDSTQLPKQPFIMIPYYSSRGCPFNCRYCADITNLNGYEKRVRYHRVEKSIEDINNLMTIFDGKKMGISFDEPIFGYYQNWRNDFLSRLIEIARSKNNVAFALETRVEFLNEHDCELYSKLDMILALGLENGAPDMLKLMNKTSDPEFYLRKMLQNRDLLEKYKIHWNANIIFGYPGETKKIFNENLRYIKKLFTNTKYGIPLFQKFMFYPGSYISQNINTPEFSKMQVMYPEWYKFLYNGYDLGNLVYPDRRRSFLTVYKKVGEFSKRYYPKLVNKFTQAPNSPLVFNYIRSTFLNDGLVNWPRNYQHFKSLMKKIKHNNLNLINIEQFIRQQLGFQTLQNNPDLEIQI